MPRLRIRRRILPNKQTNIYLGGISGVGKTLIASRLSSTNGFAHIKGSKFLMDALGVKSQKDLEKIAQPEKARIMEIAIPAALSRQEKNSIDAHFVVPTKEGYDESSLNPKIAA